jgi:hypothetical protein
MAAKRSPGAHGRCATGAGLPCYALAAGTRNLSPDTRRGNGFACRLSPFAAPGAGTPAALWLVAARIRGAMQ